MPERSSPQFVEEQQFRQFWLWLILGLTALVTIIAGVNGLGGGQGSLALLFGGTAMAVVILLMWFAKLTTTVVAGGLSLRFFPFHRRPKAIALEGLAAVEARTYRPIAEYGGWGLRRKWGGAKAYNVSGNRGVLLTYRGGKTLLIGSQRPDELAAAIEAVRDL